MSKINKENLVQSLSTNDTESRIPYVLLDLADKYVTSIKEGLEINMPITREEMSKYPGVTRETISIKLHKFVEEALITLNGNKIIIIRNYETLKYYNPLTR
ncbi:Crp/Fnr family transcriptional regulator [Clostridium sp. DL1XJH146]